MPDQAKTIEVIDLIPKEQQEAYDAIPSLPMIAQTVVPHQQAVASFEDQLTRFKIEDTDDYRNAEKLARDIKWISDKIKEDQAAITGNMRGFLKFIDGQFKTVKDRLDIIMRTVKQKMVSYNTEVQRRADEAAAAERKKQEEAALEAAATAESEGHTEEAEAIVAAAIEAPKPQTALRGVGTSMASRWVGEVVSVKDVCRAIADGQLPEEFIREFSRSNLNAFAKNKSKAGVYFGIEVKEDRNIRVR